MDKRDEDDILAVVANLQRMTSGNVSHIRDNCIGSLRSVIARDAIVELFDKWTVDGLPCIATANGAKAFVDWVQQQHPLRGTDAAANWWRANRTATNSGRDATTAGQGVGE